MSDTTTVRPTVGRIPGISAVVLLRCSLVAFRFLLNLERFGFSLPSEQSLVPTSPVVPTLSQPPEGVGDTKSRSKTTVAPTSPRGPNLLLHIHVGERKRSGTCFLYEKRRTPVGDTEVGTTSDQVNGGKR